MGWCRARTRKEVPKPWHGVEATKSEDDLRTMVDRLWRVKMGDIDKNIYKVYWADTMVKAIRTAKLAASNEGRLSTWETVVTPQNFMPRTLDQMIFLDDLRERKEMARGNRTMDDLEKEKKAEVTHLPPTTIEVTQKELCTHLHFLLVARFLNTAHYEGVMEIRRAPKFGPPASQAQGGTRPPAIG